MGVGRCNVTIEIHGQSTGDNDVRINCHRADGGISTYDTTSPPMTQAQHESLMNASGTMVSFAAEWGDFGGLLETWWDSLDSVDQQPTVRAVYARL